MPVLVDSFIVFSDYDFRYCLGLASVHLYNVWSLAVGACPILFNNLWFFVFGVSNNLNVCFIDHISVSSGIGVRNGNGNLSSYWKFVDGRSGNWNCSGNWHSLERWILNMVNIILLVVFLYNWLSDDLFSRNSDSFNSGDILSLNGFNNLFQNDFLVISSVDLNFDFFSLNNWLEDSLVVNFVSRFDNDFFSVIVSDDWILGERFEVEKLIFSGNKLNILLVVDYLFLENGLEVDSLVGVFVFSLNNFFSVSHWFGDFGQVFDSVVFLHYFDFILNSQNCWLSNSLFNDGVSRRSNLNISHNCLIAHFSILSHLFSINRSFGLTLLDDWCLDDSLLDNGLRNHFSGDDGLSDYFLFHIRSADNFLSLGNEGLGIVDLVSIGYLFFSAFICFWDFIGGLVSLLINLSSSLRLNNFDLPCFNHFLEFSFGDGFYFIRSCNRD